MVDVTWLQVEVSLVRSLIIGVMSIWYLNVLLNFRIDVKLSI